MQRVISYPVITFAISGFLLGTGYAQDKQSAKNCSRTGVANPRLIFQLRSLR
jgi:hypothetical protein